MQSAESMKALYHSLVPVSYAEIKSPSMISKTLLLVEQIRPTTTQIDNLGTTVPVLFQPRTLKAIECVTDALPAAHYAFVLVIAKGAFVADFRKSRRPHVGVAYRTLSIALIAETSDGGARLFAAHYEISVVLLASCLRLDRCGLVLTDDGATCWLRVTLDLSRRVYNL